MGQAGRSLTELAPGVHCAGAPQTFFGLELGTRMTVLELPGGLLVHSPVALPPESIQHLGDPRWVLAPNLFHHLHVGPWAAAGLEAWAAAGLAEKRPDVPFVGQPTGTAHPWGSDLRVHALTSFSLSNEVVLLHVPSRTLVVTDLVFHIQPDAPWATRAAMGLIGGYPGVATTALERLGMQRAAARRDLAEILSWDFDRVVLTHGAVVETGGKDTVARAFSWLGKLDRDA
jgi:hypothetical protein